MVVRGGNEAINEEGRHAWEEEGDNNVKKIRIKTSRELLGVLQKARSQMVGKGESRL